MIYSDYHIHTKFSGDSNAEFADIVTSALQKGLTEICITDHQDFGYIADGVLFELNSDEYYNTLCEISERYIDKLIIKKGIETGLEPEKAPLLHDFVNSHDYDFVIGSSHLVNGMDPYYPEYFNNRTDKQAFLEYFESILENLKYCHDFDVYGHIDYVVRYAPNKADNYHYSDFFEIIDEILKKLIDSGKGIEVNTSGYRSGLPFPNPCIDIIKRYHELGGEILTIGSDAHYSQHIGYNFDKIYTLLKESGINYYTTFHKRKPEFIKLS